MDARIGLERWLQPLLAKLEPQAKRTLTRQIAQALRLRFKDRIAQQKDPDGIAFVPRKRNQIGNIKRQGAMFQRLPRQLKIRYTKDQAEVGFAGRDAFVAKVHQQGLTTRPSQKSRPTQYAVRKLVGFGKEDEEWVMRMVEDYFAIN